MANTAVAWLGRNNRMLSAEIVVGAAKKISTVVAGATVEVVRVGYAYTRHFSNMCCNGR